MHFAYELGRSLVKTAIFTNDQGQPTGLGKVVAGAGGFARGELPMMWDSAKKNTWKPAPIKTPFVPPAIMQTTPEQYGDIASYFLAKEPSGRAGLQPDSIARGEKLHNLQMETYRQNDAFTMANRPAPSFKDPNRFLLPPKPQGRP